MENTLQDIIASVHSNSVCIAHSGYFRNDTALLSNHLRRMHHLLFLMRLGMLSSRHHCRRVKLWPIRPGMSLPWRDIGCRILQPRHVWLLLWRCLLECQAWYTVLREDPSVGSFVYDTTPAQRRRGHSLPRRHDTHSILRSANSSPTECPRIYARSSSREHRRAWDGRETSTLGSNIFIKLRDISCRRHMLTALLGVLLV